MCPEANSSFLLKHLKGFNLEVIYKLNISYISYYFVFFLIIIIKKYNECLDASQWIYMSL